MLRVFSFGGGVQSTAALVLAAQGRINYRTFLFCNVGHDSENPDTLAYVQQVALPFAASHGLALLELRKKRRLKTDEGPVSLPETIYEQLTRPGSRSIGIPVHMAGGAPGRRSCTIEFKIEVCDRWLREHGVQMALDFERRLARLLSCSRDADLLEASADDLLSLARLPRPLAVVGLGISLDEWQRMRTDSGAEWKALDYPLIDLRLDRRACMRIIEDAGLPVPPKSSCFFCPFHSSRSWQDLRDHHPSLFESAVRLEQVINLRRAMLGKDAVYLHHKCKPLERATSPYAQPSLFDDEPDGFCESGYCFV